jgi:hypothetical protein
MLPLCILSNATTSRSRPTYAICWNSRITNDTDTNGPAYLCSTTYPKFSPQSSRLTSHVSVAPNGPPFWALYIHGPLNSRKSPSSVHPPPLIHQGVQVYHTPLKAQQSERSQYLFLNMGTPHHTTTITRFVDRFFRNTTPHTFPLQLTNIYEVKQKNTLLKIPVSARKRGNHPPDASSPLPQSPHPPNSPFQPTPAAGILSHQLEESQSHPHP